MIHNKKGDGNMFWVIAGAILALILVFILGPFIKHGIDQSGTTLDDQLESINDCDKDGIVNRDDLCPCIFEDREKELKGCPLGITTEQSQKDIKECFSKYADPTTPGNLLDVCADGQEECLLHCDYVHKYVAPQSAVSASSIQGTRGNWDLQIKKFAVKVNGVEQSHGEFDLQNQEGGDVPIVLQIENNGAQAITTQIKYGILACDEAGLNCDPLTFWSESGLGSFEKVDKESTILVAANSDPCVGSGTKKCSLVLAVDTDTTLNEGVRGEANNVQKIPLTLTNQRWSASDKFETTVQDAQAQQSKGDNVRWAIELMINDEGDPDVEQKEIRQACAGYIGDNGDVGAGFVCPSSESSCGKGEFPRGADGERFSSDKGCLVVVSEDDPTNDCGYAGVQTNFLLDIDNYRIINQIKTVFRDTTIGNDADNAMSYQWKAKASEGSLLCNEGHWLLCDGAVERQLAITGNGARWRCESSHWAKR